MNSKFVAKLGFVFTDEKLRAKTKIIKKIEKGSLFNSASELNRPSDRRLSTKLVPAFADSWCHVVSVTDPYGRILDFPDRSRYCFFQVALQLYSRG
jgi:hypothetical protein